MKKKSIAAFIAVNNNPEILDKCLAQMQFVDEFIISDVSTNKKIEILLSEKYPKARHFYHENIDIKKRILEAQNLMRSDYLMLTSFDEFFTKELADEIIQILSLDEDFDALQISSMEYSFGACFGRGEYYNKIIKKGKIKYGNSNVHEFASVDGIIKKLYSFYEHHSNPMLAVNAVKMFKFEMINAQKFTDEELHQASIEKMSGFQLFKTALTNWLRLSVRFWRAFKNYRKYGYGGLCYAYSDIIRVIAEHTSPTQELQFREGRVNRNDTRGYL
ncbi:MAG: hypothetical protein J0I09_05240 [Sphingobacteriia bacterium]|nr:hypothetical protein [Sphingobacteriia bacterium]